MRVRQVGKRGALRGDMLDPMQQHQALISQNLLRAANDGYDVSPLIEHGADPMASGECCLSIARQVHVWAARSRRPPC